MAVSIFQYFDLSFMIKDGGRMFPERFDRVTKEYQSAYDNNHYQHKTIKPQWEFALVREAR